MTKIRIALVLFALIGLPVAVAAQTPTTPLKVAFDDSLSSQQFNYADRAGELILLLQPVGATDKFAWGMEAPLLTTVQGWRYDVELDGAILVLSATCTGASSPFDCTAPIPAVTPGEHKARLRGADATVTGPFSDLLTFTMRAVPGKPLGFTVRPGA